MKTKAPVPEELSSHLFWDVEISELDLDRHAGYIIPRVMDYGNWDEVRHILDHYPEAVIKDTLVKAPSLQKLTLNFFHTLYKIPLEEFKAWNKLQLAFWER
ncbi:MAG TPA: hypothetical protein PLQ80_09760 [Candidatus Syntrophosphaera sp.]|nr:hypothetical protein [Candidatus Syntrophosphaera sp.]